MAGQSRKTGRHTKCARRQAGHTQQAARSSLGYNPNLEASSHTIEKSWRALARPGAVPLSSLGRPHASITGKGCRRAAVSTGGPHTNTPDRLFLGTHIITTCPRRHALQVSSHAAGRHSRLHSMGGSSTACTHGGCSLGQLLQAEAAATQLQGCNQRRCCCLAIRHGGQCCVIPAGSEQREGLFNTDCNTAQPWAAGKQGAS